MAKRWKKEDETYLKRYAKTKKLAELEARFKTDRETVLAKLGELGLAAKDSVEPLKVENDPLVKVLEKGVRALHRKQWKPALDAFEQVIEEADFSQLAQAARRYAQVARQNLSPASEPKDAFLQAVLARNRGDLEHALDLSTRAGRVGKDERFAYLAAGIYALQGDLDKAASTLSGAIELNPKNRVHAFHDPDFEDLKRSQEYASLFDASS